MEYLNKFQYMYKKVSSSLCSSINNFIRDKERDGMPYTIDDIRRYMERGFNVMKSKYSFVTDEMLDKCISFVVKELDDREGLYFLKNNKMNENNMKRKAIKINESDLHRMIKRSVSRILNEIYKSEEPELYYILHGDEFIDDLMSEEEYENGRINLQKAGCKIDYVITHTFPVDSKGMLGGIKDLPEERPLTYYLQHDVFDALSDQESFVKEPAYKHWYFGHLHIDKEIWRRQYAVLKYVRDLRTGEIVFTRTKFAGA